MKSHFIEFLFTFVLNIVFIRLKYFVLKKSLLLMSYVLTFAPFAEEALRDNKNLGFVEQLRFKTAWQFGAGRGSNLRFK